LGGLGFSGQGSGFMVHGSGFMVQGFVISSIHSLFLDFRCGRAVDHSDETAEGVVPALGFRVHGLGFSICVQGLGFRV